MYIWFLFRGGNLFKRTNLDPMDPIDHMDLVSRGRCIEWVDFCRLSRAFDWSYSAGLGRPSENLSSTKGGSRKKGSQEDRKARRVEGRKKERMAGFELRALVSIRILLINHWKRYRLYLWYVDNAKTHSFQITKRNWNVQFFLLLSKFFLFKKNSRFSSSFRKWILVYQL